MIDIRSKQHILRVDVDNISNPLSYADIIPHDLETADGIVISDYGKGFVSYDLVSQLISNFHKPIFIDTKKSDVRRFEGCHVKINEIEFARLESWCTGLIVTLGAHGVKYHGKVYTPEVVEVVDVCGAGDTFLAAYACKFLQSQDAIEAIRFGNKAAGITVQHSGVYSPTLKELE
jgi:D-beta-D-heptose 7-phosphate kinase/D-beta-D-heptose 1-phosphate adenosyltransferase